MRSKAFWLPCSVILWGWALSQCPCPAADSVTLSIMTKTGSRIAVEDALSFNAGTIFQGLASLGFTDATPHPIRKATDNRAIPATLPSMTVASWPLLPGLTSKGLLSKPDEAGLARRIGLGLSPEDRAHLAQRSRYYPPIEEPDFVIPSIQQTFRVPPERQLGAPQLNDRPMIQAERGGIGTSTALPNIEVPRFERPDYDYSGPPFIYTAPPELLKNPLVANDPSMLRLFIKTNHVGARDALNSVDAARPVRRLRPASYWDYNEPSNNPRADYDTASDYEAKARNTTKSVFDLRDPAAQVGANDPRPSYDSRPSFNPPNRSPIRTPGAR